VCVSKLTEGKQCCERAALAVGAARTTIRPHLAILGPISPLCEPAQYSGLPHIAPHIAPHMGQGGQRLVGQNLLRQNSAG
jgi:hypothetical protein